MIVDVKIEFRAKFSKETHVCEMRCDLKYGWGGEGEGRRRPSPSIARTLRDVGLRTWAFLIVVKNRDKNLLGRESSLLSVCF